MSFSPGPWGQSTYDPCIIENGEKMRIASVNEFRKSVAEIEANTALISAAPEMFKALQKLNDIYGDFSRDSFDLSEIRSIIRSSISRASGGKL